MKDLIKKQEKEFDKKFSIYDINYGWISFFIKKVRKETAEFVANKMIGEKINELFTDTHTGEKTIDIVIVGYNERIKKEKELKQQILKELL